MPMSITPPDALCTYTSSTRVYARMTNQMMHFISLHWEKLTSGCWFSRTALGHKKDGGIQGFKTNHSLRSAAASCLYQAGVDKQLVMEKTGHRSLEGIRSYKHTCYEQRIALSDILNQKKPRQDIPHESQLERQNCQVRDDEQSHNTLDIRYAAQSAFNFNLTCGTVAKYQPPLSLSPCLYCTLLCYSNLIP